MTLPLPCSLIQEHRARLLKLEREGEFFDEVELIVQAFFGEACSYERTTAILETVGVWAAGGNVMEFCPLVSGNFHHPPQGSAHYWISLVLDLSAPAASGALVGFDPVPTAKDSV